MAEFTGTALHSLVRVGHRADQPRIDPLGMVHVARAAGGLLVAIVVIGLGLMSSLPAMLTPPTPFARNVLSVEQAQNLAALWQADHHSIGRDCAPTMLRLWPYVTGAARVGMVHTA